MALKSRKQKSDQQASPDAPEKVKRSAQLRAAFTMTRRSDPRFLLAFLSTGVGVFVVMLALGFVFGQPIFWGIAGVFLAAAAMMVVFTRRAQAAAYREIEGQPGAAAAVLQGMRGDWRVTPAVAFNRNQDLVHRVVGKPGVILVGEGSPARLGQLIAQEKRRVQRVAADTPMYEFQVGNEDGQIPLRRLQSKMMRLPRNLRGAGVNAVDGRMRALGGPNVPLPKGPLPKNMRMPRGKLR
jgi:hypothetical protein